MNQRYVFDLRLNLWVLVILFSAFLGELSKANTVIQCRPMVESALFNPKPPNLHDVYYQDIQNKSAEQIKTENKEFLTDLQATLPPPSAGRAQSVPFELAYRILDIVEKHPVVGRLARERYLRDGVEIGYCFGRAMYIHLLLLKMGVQKESIRKIWAIGPIKTSSAGITWAYHVSILVYTKEMGWITIDTNESKPQPVRVWVDSYSEKSVDGKIRFYITEPEKFGVDTLRYSRVNLGFKLSRQEDWYQHYFVDMLAAIRTETLAALRLEKLNPADQKVEVSEAYKPPRRPETFLEKLQDTFWIFN